jgi:acyl transferase domain-containing protein
MSDVKSGQDGKGALAQRALLAVKETRERLEAIEYARREPIAIVGIGCRLPGGASSAREYWRLLRQQVDAIREVPPERWDTAAYYDPEPGAPGRTHMRYGGFLEGVDRFDPYFFGISPREASQMDPQQRLFLEVAWEALEDAGLPLERLAGTDAGVFVGANASDYLQLQLSEPEQLGTYSLTGGVHCIIANRLSYLLDLHGPSLSLDTACSSSLVAVHLACQSLRLRECGVAIAAGMNVILSPQVTVAHSKGLPLAPDGRCKTFDARADGYTRGEGVGVVILKRLSDAVADGDRIHAVVRGSAVNQDGLTNGLTAPNGRSQREVIQRALKAGRLQPAQVGFVEAHGTGTSLGDPIEVEALREIYGEPGPEAGRCALGSVKTNIGHLEAGAGIAGLIKVALALQHRTIPGNLHFQSLNPHISLEGSRLFIPTQAVEWTAPDEQRLGAVSSFGAGGTNAHVVLGPAPAPADAARAEPSMCLLPLSARSPAALVALASAWRDWLRSEEGRAEPLHALCAAAARRRSHHAYRLAVPATSHEDAASRLASLAEEGPAALRRAASRRGRIVFVFPGQGSQWAGMGRALMRDSATFRDTIHRCEQAFRPHVDWSLSQVLEAREGSPGLERIDIIQPVLFALALGLVEEWRALGVEPDAVVGHSMGEVAAACVAGALSLEDAARVICRRSQLLLRTSGQGAMALVGLSMEAAEALIADRRERVSVAVSNSPLSTVLSGDKEVIASLVEELRRRNVFARPVKVDVASHSPQMDVLREALLEALREVSPRAGTLPIYSTVTGEPCDGAGFDAGYWVRNLREPVLFSGAVKRLVEEGANTFIEVSAHPLLTTAIEQGFEHAGTEGVALPSMRRDEDARTVLLESLGALYAQGAAMPWERLYPGTVRGVELPRYPWQHERFWYRQGPATATPRAASQQAPVSPEAPAPASAPTAGTELLRLMGEVAPEARREALMELVRDTVAGVLGFEPSRVEPDLGFFQMGMDSMMAGAVRRRLEAALARKFPTTLLFEQPTVARLSGWLAQSVRVAGAPEAVAPTAPVPSLPARAAPPPPTPPEQDPDALSEEELLALLNQEVDAARHVRGATRPQS